MIVEVVSEIVKVLSSEGVDSSKSLQDNIALLMQESDFVWRKDYTIAVAKDNSKTKIANFMVCDKLDETPQTFKVKREKDFWQKLQAREDYKAVVECSSFGANTDLYDIETQGRDIMRSRKEVPTVAVGGFVWVVAIDDSVNLDALFELYFKENYKVVNRDEANYYIGWTDNLKTLDMRHFICNPTTKQLN